jgi:V-type H+-transporting ATPase proteolipid subunit
MSGVDPALCTGLGAALSIFLSAVGASIASAEAGIYALHSRSGLLKSFVPIVIAGVLAIYGIIVGVLLSGKLHQASDVSITTAEGYRFLSAGLSVGLACAASGFGLARFIKQSNATSARPSGSAVAPESRPLLGSNDGVVMAVPHLDIRYFFVLVFLEAIALYGLIVALFLIGK